MILGMFVILGAVAVPVILLCANVRYQMGKTDEGFLPVIGTAGNLMMFGPVTWIFLFITVHESEPATWMYASCLTVWGAGCALLLFSHSYVYRQGSKEALHTTKGRDS